MKTEIKQLIEKHQAGNQLAMGEIHALMIYASELLKEFEGHTMASIENAQKLIEAQYKKAA
jgi:hypothetical protein